MDSTRAMGNVAQQSLKTSIKSIAKNSEQTNISYKIKNLLHI